MAATTSSGNMTTTTTSTSNTSPYNDPPSASPNTTTSMKHIPTPLHTDVICGRGGGALRHPGNQTYRRIVTLNKGLYTTCKKSDKLKISRSIVAAIREQNGRFLERDNNTKLWYDIGDKKAIEKTSQALREGQPLLRKRINDLENKGELPVGGAAAVTLKPGEPTREKKQSRKRSSSLNSSNSTIPNTGGGMEGDSAGAGAGASPDEAQPPPNDQNRKSFQEEENAGTPDSKRSSASSGVVAATAAAAFIARSSPQTAKQEESMEAATNSNHENGISDELRNLPLDHPSSSLVSAQSSVHQSFHNSDATELMGNLHHSQQHQQLHASRVSNYHESFQDSFGDFDPSALELVQQQYGVRRGINIHPPNNAMNHAMNQRPPVPTQVPEDANSGSDLASDMLHVHHTLTQQHEDYLQQQQQQQKQYNFEQQQQQQQQQQHDPNQLPPSSSQKRKLSYRKLCPFINYKNLNHDLGIESSCRSIMSDFSALSESMKSMTMLDADSGDNEGGEEVMIWDAAAAAGGVPPPASAAPTENEQDRRSYFLKVKNYRAHKLQQLQNNHTISTSNKAITSLTRLNDEHDDDVVGGGGGDDDGLAIHESCMLESNQSLLSNFSITPTNPNNTTPPSTEDRNFKDGDLTIDGNAIIMTPRSSMRSSISTLSRDVKAGVIGGGMAGDLDFDLQSKQSLFSSFSSGHHHYYTKTQQQQHQQQVSPLGGDDSGSGSKGGGGGGDSSGVDASMCQSMQSLAVSEFSAVEGEEEERNKILSTFENTPAVVVPAVPSSSHGEDQDL